MRCENRLEMSNNKPLTTRLHKTTQSLRARFGRGNLQSQSEIPRFTAPPLKPMATRGRNGVCEISWFHFLFRLSILAKNLVSSGAADCSLVFNKLATSRADAISKTARLTS